MDTEFLKLDMESRRSTTHVHLAHDSDQITSHLRDSRSARLTMANLPGPIRTERFPMPTHDRFSFDDDQGGAPTRPNSRQANPKPPICRAQHKALGLQSSLQHEHLMAQCDDFGPHCRISLK